MTSHVSGALLISGREPERERLRRLLDAAAQGNGCAVLIGGEAGIGKTTLVDDLARHAREQATDVVAGSCYDLSITPPYGPWKDAAERSGWRELAGLLYRDEGDPHSQRRDELFLSAMRLVMERAAASPLLIVLEDLHWADAASLDLLRYVARYTHQHNVLLALTYRDDELTRDHPLFQLMPLLVREARAERIDLHPLDDADVRVLVSDRYRLDQAHEQLLVRYLQQHAEGNPFFVGEILRTLESEQLLLPAGPGWVVGDLDRAPVPPLVLQVIEGRLSRLSPATRGLLEAAATIGQVVPFDIWQSMTGAGIDELLSATDQASAIHVLTWLPGDTHMHFDHALTREALFAGIPPPRRRVLHQQAVGVLLELKEPDPDAVSYHLQQSGDPRAVEWLVRAGLRARRSGAWITAADRFRMAAALLAEDDERASLRGWLLFYTGFLLRFSNDPETLEYLYEAERVALKQADVLLAALVLYHRGSSHCMRGDLRTGQDELRRGVEQLEALPEGSEHLETEAEISSTIQALTPGFSIVRPTTAPSTGRQSRAWVSQQRGVLIQWLSQIGHFHEVLELGAAFAGNISSQTPEPLAESPQIASGRCGLARAYSALGRPDEARMQLESARRSFSIASDHVMAEYTLSLDIQLVATPYWTDRVSERERLRAEAARAWSRASDMSVIARDDISPSELFLCLLEGHWDTAYRIAAERRSAITVGVVHEAIAALATLDHRMGNPGLAWERVRQLLPDGPASEPGDSHFQHAIATLELAADMALDAGDLDTASAWIQAHTRWLDWNGAILWQAQNRLLRARYHRLTGNLKRARNLTRDALELASEPRQPLQLLSAQRFIAELDILEGAHERASEHLQRARMLAEACRVPYEEGLTMLVTAGLNAATGRLEDAAGSARRARDIFSALGARPARERADRLLDDITSRPAGAPAYPDGLTRREAEVLRLIAQGKSNRVIAEELFLSTRTVERHIANIYLKIDVHNKAEATAFALRNNLV